MFNILRKSSSSVVLRDADSFWAYVSKRERFRHTPPHEAELEERLDLQAALTIKELLERECGPEEGPNPVQRQAWDWNDSRSRGIYILKSVFRPDLVPQLQALLVDEFSDFQLVVLIHESWEEDAWGGLHLTSSSIGVEKVVATAYSLA